MCLVLTSDLRSDDGSGLFLPRRMKRTSISSSKSAAAQVCQESVQSEEELQCII